MKTFSSSLILLATSLAMVSAIPHKPSAKTVAIAKTRTCQALKPVSIDFDKNNYTPSKLLPLMSDATAMKSGIEFSGFYGFQNEEKGGVAPSTAPNQIVGGAINGLLEGNHTMFVQPGNPSGTQYFDLNAFSFGCTLITNDVLGLLPPIAAECKMTMLGYYMGQLVGNQTYEFKPDGQLQSDSRRVVMNDVTCHENFRGVDMIQFELSDKLLKVINLDTFKVTPHKCKDKKH